MAAIGVVNRSEDDRLKDVDGRDDEGDESDGRHGVLLVDFQP